MDKAVAGAKGPHGVVCPSCYVSSHANGCLYRCDYCCLQLPLKSVQKPVIFAKQDKLLDEGKAFLKRERPQILSADESSELAPSFDSWWVRVRCTTTGLLGLFFARWLLPIGLNNGFNGRS